MSQHGARRLVRGLVWLIGCVFALGAWQVAVASDGSLRLTAEEQAWLQAHPVIRVAYDPSWPPFSFHDKDGKFTGLDADVLELLAVRLGVKFEPVHYRDWLEAYDKGVRHQVDFLLGTALTPDRAARFKFTAPYQAIPVGIITRHDRPFLWSVVDLQDHTLAVVEGYAATEALRRDYPAIKLVPAPTMADAFERVSEGQAEAVVTNLVNASYIIKTRGLTNLKIAGIFPDTFELRYAVREDWPELLGILEKGVASISRSDLLAVNHRWVRVDYAKVIRWDLVWKTALGILAVVGVVIGFLWWHYRAVRRELTARKALQKTLEATNTRLNASNSELAARHQEISALMSVAAHDLRSPLTALSLTAQMLNQSSELKVQERGRMIVSNADQMCRLIDNLLDVHALEKGKREFNVGLHSPVGVMFASAESLAPLAEAKHIALDTEGLRGWTGVVRVDEAALRQVFDNLVSNAIKFSPLGRTVSLRVFAWNEFVRCEVEDQGPGVPMSERERIFAKYARGTAKPTAGEKSTGLGLAIVREVVAAMNGRVWCEDGRSGGACFVVVLPVVVLPNP